MEQSTVFTVEFRTRYLRFVKRVADSALNGIHRRDIRTIATLGEKWKKIKWFLWFVQLTLPLRAAN